MRMRILCAVTMGGALAVFGCSRTQSNMARAPRVDLPASSPALASSPARETKTGAVYDTQKGFENRLPAPDAVGGGPIDGVDSDVGEPKWRKNPGSFDDGTRPKHQNQNEQNEYILPPDTQP